MTDPAFELLLGRTLSSYAQGGVRDVDPMEIAQSVVATHSRRTLIGRLGLNGRARVRPVFGSMAMLVILGLILTIVLALVVGSMLRALPVEPLLGRNGLIAYQVNDIPGRPYNHLRVMNADGSNDHEVAQGTAPMYSRDGKTLAYFSGWGAGETNLRLWVANGDGSNMREVSAFNQRGLDLSPDGTQFLVLSDRDGLLDFGPPGAMGLISAVDGSVRLLVDPPVNGERYWDQHWSPDGKSIAYAVMREVTNGGNGGMFRDRIDVVDVETGDVRTLTHRLGTDGTGIAWSPDSKQIAYNGLPDGAPAPSLGDGSGSTNSFYPDQDVFVINADGSNDRNITNTPESESSSLQWSPDSRSVAFQVFDTDAGNHIVVLDVDAAASTGEPRQGPAADAFAFSPDGNLIVYVVSVEGPPTAEGQQQFTSEILTIDAAFTQDPVTLVTLDSGAGRVTWQWLAP